MATTGSSSRMSARGGEDVDLGVPLRVELAGCCACRSCEVACSYHLTGAFSPAASAVVVSYDGHTGSVDVDFTAACDGCGTEPTGPLCAIYCPFKVIRRPFNP